MELVDYNNKCECNFFMIYFSFRTQFANFFLLRANVQNTTTSKIHTTILVSVFSRKKKYFVKNCFFVYQPNPEKCKQCKKTATRLYAIYFGILKNSLEKACSTRATESECSFILRCLFCVNFNFVLEFSLFYENKNILRDKSCVNKFF